MQASADSSSPACPLSAAGVAVEGVRGNTPAAPTGAHTSDTTRTAERAVDERTPPRIAAPASSVEALAKVLAMCLVRICRLEERQARGEAQQSIFGTALQALLIQAHGQQQQQQQQSCGQAAIEVHGEDGDANSSDAHDRERSEQYPCSRHTTSCRTSSWSHVNRPPALGGSSNGSRHHSEDGYDRAAVPSTAAAASELHSQQRCRRHRSLRHTQGSDMHRPHGADAPASSSLESTATADISAAAAATAAGAAVTGSEGDDAHANHSTGSQHHRHQSPGAGTATGAVPSPSPADLANTKWKEASSGTGAGVGGGCTHAIPSTTAPGNYRNTPTASAAVASGSINELPMISHFGSPSGGGGRQRQGSLVTVVSPTHTSQAEEAEAHAIAASERISAGVSSAPAGAMPVNCFTWAVPVTPLSSSENSRCSTPVELHMSARSLSQQQQQQQPTQPSTEEWSSCICGHRAEGTDEVTYNGPDAAPSVHPQQQRGSRGHLRSSPTHVAPLADHPQRPPARLHQQPAYRKGEDRELSSSSRLAATALRSAGSTATSSAAHTGDELDVLFHALSAPHPAASVPASSDSAAASGAQATGTLTRRVQYPAGTDNTTAINELFAQAVQNTMEMTRMKENLTVLVLSVHKEREKRRRLQRREGSAVQRLVQRVLDMSSVMLRLQRTVRRLELEANSGHASDAAGWHHHHNSHRRRRGADSSRSAGVSDQDEDTATCDGDVDDGESEWCERFCASFSTASVAVSRSRRSGSVTGSGHRQSVGDRSGNVGYAALAAPFSSSWSLSAGCERVVPAVRSPWLSSLTTQCSTDVARGEAILGRGGAVPTGTVTSTPVVDDVGNTSTSPAPPGTVSPQRLAGATPVTAAPAAASAGPLLVAGSVALPKIISSSSSLHSLVTASAAITTNVNTTAAATTTTTATTSRAASATLVPQSMVSSSVSAPRRERLPSLLLSPPAMLDVCATESRSSAVTSNSSVVPALSITDVHFGLALACRESATEDKLPALGPDAAAVGRGSGGPRAEGASNSATHDGDAHRGGCPGQRSEVDGARHDGEKEQRHLAQPPQQKQRRQDVSGGSSTSSRCRQREHSMRRAAPATIATTAVLMPIPGGTQHSFASAQHPPAPPPRQTTSSRKSPASAFAGTSSAAARENSSVPARRLLDALNSEHRSGAVTGASTVVNVAAETGGKGHGVSSGTGAVNTTTTASTDPPAASLTSSVAAPKFTGSTANLACRTLNGVTATALAQLASAPVTARPRRRQQRSGSSIAKPSPGRREARRPWSGLIQSASPATPRSKAAAADRRGDMRDDACGTDATSSAALQGGEGLPTWRNAAISASPTQSSSDRSRSSHPQHSLLSSWLQSPPARMATAAGGDDKTILSPVTPTGATTITAGGEKLCRPSAGAYRSHSNSGSIPSTPSQRLNAQLAPSPASTPAVGAGGASVSSPSSKLQLAQPVIPISVGHHPQQLLQTTATSHQARKWTSIPLLSSATVSGTLPHVPMMASVQSASSFLRITSILLSPSMAHPASPVSPLATGSPACAGTGTGSSGATAGSLPARIAQPVSPLSSTSRLDQYHRPHSSRALYLSANCSSNTNASLAAPRTPPHGHPPNLAHQQPGDAAVQSQHAVVLSRSAAALMQTTNTLPRVVASPASSSRSSRVTPLIALRRTKPLAPAAAALASLQPAQSGYEAKTLARTAVAPTGKTQRPANSAKVSGKAKQAPPSSPLVGRDSAAVARGVATHEQALCSSSLVAHHPCSSPLKLTGDPGHRPQPRLQTPSSAQEGRSGRRARAGLPPPLSVETLSDASVSALRTSSVGTTGSMDVEKGITKGDVGDGVSGPAMHDHGGGSCSTLVTLSAVAGAAQHRGYSTQLHPPELIAEEGQEKTGRERSTPAGAAVPSLPGTPTALVIAGVRGAMRSANRGSNASDAGVDRAISLEDGEDVDDDDDSSVQQALRTPLQQQQLRRPLGCVNAAEQPPMHFSFLFDASTPVSMLSGALQRNRSSLNQQQQQQHHKRTAASVGPASAMPNTASHDSCASSSHTSTSAISSPSGTRSS